MSSEMSAKSIAVDIDDTLAETSLAVIDQVNAFLSVQPEAEVKILLKEYAYPALVPAWSSPSIQRFIFDLLNDAQFLRCLKPVEGSVEVLQKVHQHRPVAAYITSRLTTVQDLTQTWLEEHGYPVAPVICRQVTELSPTWKLQYLATHLPQVAGLIDNDLGLLPVEKIEYKGALWWLNRFGVNSSLTDQVIQVRDWFEAESAIRSV